MPEIKHKVEVEIDVEIDVYCASCGEDISQNVTVSSGMWSPRFDIEPCLNCINQTIEDVKTK